MASRFLLALVSLATFRGLIGFAVGVTVGIGIGVAITTTRSSTSTELSAAFNDEFLWSGLQR